MNIDKIAIGQNPPFDINVIIEIPQGGEPVKYEFDKESGALVVDRFLHTAMFYPGNYGFIPHTLAEDGDPCDVLVVGRTPVVPGAIIRSRPVGALLWRTRPAPTRRSSPSRSMPSTPITRGCAPMRTCPSSCAIRSPISFSITRTWKRANGSRSCARSGRTRVPS